LFNASGGDHALLFVIAAGAIVVALLLELGMRLLNRRDQLTAVIFPAKTRSHLLNTFTTGRRHESAPNHDPD
jgi:hypothetical protein